MSFPKLSPGEIEGDRLRQASELAAESGEGWTAGYLPGSSGCHELLDRAALLSHMLERYLLGHPACVANPEWNLLAEQAAATLGELYQRVGAQHLEGEAPSGQAVTGISA